MTNKEAIVIIVAFFIACFVLFMCGCSANTQSAYFTSTNPDTGVVNSVKLSVSKHNFLYGSKFQADTDTFGMKVNVHNAEGKPDEASVKAMVEGIIAGLEAGL